MLRILRNQQLFHQSHFVCTCYLEKLFSYFVLLHLLPQVDSVKRMGPLWKQHKCEGAEIWREKKGVLMSCCWISEQLFESYLIVIGTCKSEVFESYFRVIGRNKGIHGERFESVSCQSDLLHSYLRVTLQKIQHIFQKNIEKKHKITIPFEVCFEISR